jgi:hypothetical protein
MPNWWGKKDEELPESIRNMKPEDLATAVQKANEVDALKTQLSDATTKLSEFDSVKSRLAQLESSVKPAVKQEGPAAPVSFLENEDLAFAQRMQPFATLTLQNQARSAKFMAKQTLSGAKLAMFTKYEGEIDEMMKSVDLAYQGTPESWLKVFNSVLGNHIDDITTAAKDGSDFFAETHVVGVGGGAPPVDPNVLTEEDKRIAKRLGLTDDQYKASKKEMVIRVN